MKIENWIAIATMIATLAGPSFAVWLQKRLERPKATPQTNQPKLRSFFINLLASQGLTLIIAFLSIIFAAYFLFKQVSSQEPITRPAVFSIILFTGTIIYHLILSLFALSIREVIRFQGKLVGSYEKLVSSHGRVIDSHNKLVEIVEEYESKLSKPKTKKRRD